MSGWTTAQQKASGGNPYLQEALNQVQDSPITMYRVTRSYYNSTDDNHLRINRGDVVEVDPSEQDGLPPEWLYGRLNGLSGLFPADRVQAIRGQTANRPPQNEPTKPWGKKANQGRQPSSDARSSNTNSISDELPADCRTLCVYEAKYDFEAKSDEELTIRTGDFINVQSSVQVNVDPGWLFGWIGERAGLFPEGYVTLVKETDSDDDYIPMKEEEILPPFGMQKERVRPLRESIDSLMDMIDDSCTALEDTKEEFFVGRLSKVTSSQEDYKRVLENWDSFIRHMKELLRSLRSNEKVAREDPSQWAVGDILSEKLLQVDKFTKCCNWRKDAEALLQKQSKYAIQKHIAGIFKASDRADKSLEMDTAELVSILQLPAKHINKYPGVIKKIVETTPPDHGDHECIKAAFVMSKDICLLISKTNEDTKHTEEMTRIQDIVKGSHTDFLSDTDCLGQRKLCYTSKLQEIKGGQRQDCVGFLLNDQLLLCYPRSTKIPDAYMTNAAKITFQPGRPHPIYLNNLEVLLREVSDPTVFTVLCYDDPEVICLNLKAPSPRERNLWTEKIEEAAKRYSTAKKKRLYSRHHMDADSSRTTYVAKYTFNTDYPEALNFTTGNVIKVGQRQDAANPGWMFGTFSNEYGWFPRVLVEPIPDSEESSMYIEQPFEAEQPDDKVEKIPEWNPVFQDGSKAAANQTYLLEQAQLALKKTDQFGHADTLPQYNEPQKKFVKPKKVAEDLDIVMTSPRPPADMPATLPRPMAKSSDQPKPTSGIVNFRESPKLPAKKDRSKETQELQKPPIQKKGPKVLNQAKPVHHIADLQSALKARKHSGPPTATSPTDKPVSKPNKQWTPMVAMKPSDLKLRTPSESSADQAPKPMIPPRRGGPPH